MASPSTGYSESVKFVQMPPEELQTECSICLQVLSQPRMVNCCGNRFCAGCIGRVEEARRPCPLCTQPFMSVADKQLERAIKSFHVFCRHREEGCEWRGELGQLENHLNPPVTQSSGPANSLQGCPYQSVKCDQCDSNVKRHMMEGHLSECFVACKYSSLGCNHTCSKDMLQRHMDESIDYHLSLVADQMTRSSHELTRKLRSEVQVLKKVLQRSKRRHPKEITGIQLALLCIIVAVMFMAGLYFGRSSNIQKDQGTTDLASLDKTISQIIALTNRDHEELVSAKKQLNQLKAESHGELTKGLPFNLDDLKSEVQYNSEQIDFPVLPVTLKVTNFRELKTNGDAWLSMPFYTTPKGYKMRLVVYPDGHGSGAGTHLSLYLHVMRGRCDENLNWPLNGHFTVSVLNQNDYREYVSQVISFPNDGVGFTSGQSLDTKILVSSRGMGVGYAEFLNHRKGLDLDGDIEYIKNDALLIKIDKRQNWWEWFFGIFTFPVRFCLFIYSYIYPVVTHYLVFSFFVTAYTLARLNLRIRLQQLQQTGTGGQ